MKGCTAPPKKDTHKDTQTHKIMPVSSHHSSLVEIGMLNNPVIKPHHKTTTKRDKTRKRHDMTTRRLKMTTMRWKATRKTHLLQ